MTDEQWLPVVGFEGSYQVSDHGRVRSLDRVIQHSVSGPSRRHGRVLKAAVGKTNGYLVVTLYHGDGWHRTYCVHTLVLEAFVGPRPTRNHEACHRDADRQNARLDNLRWDTSSENNLDSVRSGHHELANRERCPRGHRLVLPNLVVCMLRKGSRSCRACANARSVLHKRRTLTPESLQVEADYRYSVIMQASA